MTGTGLDLPLGLGFANYNVPHFVRGRGEQAIQSERITLYAPCVREGRLMPNVHFQVAPSLT